MDYLMHRLTNAGGFERQPRATRRSLSEIGLYENVTAVSRKAQIYAFMSKTLQVEKEDRNSQFDKYIRKKVQKALEQSEDAQKLDERLLVSAREANGCRNTK